MVLNFGNTWISAVVLTNCTRWIFIRCLLYVVRFHHVVMVVVFYYSSVKYLQSVIEPGVV